MEYAGTAIDGPKRGQQIKHYDSYFQCNVVMTPISVWADWQHTPPVVEYQVVTYKWSPSLGQWCMIY